MASAGYKLLGFLVWRGARWYLRRRVSSRMLVMGAIAGLALTAGAALLARRAMD